MKLARGLIIWALAITITWAAVILTAAFIIAGITLAIQQSPTAAWALLALALAATILGAVDYVRNHQ